MCGVGPAARLVRLTSRRFADCTAMKRLLLLSLEAAVLAGCTFSVPDGLLAPWDAIASPRPVTRAPASATPRPSATPTITPTLPTSTFTPTPTVLGGLPTISISETPTLTPTLIQLVLGGILTRTSAVDGFVSIILSDAQLYWGDCEGPHEAIVTAQVSVPASVNDVTLFVRLKYKTLDVYSDWDAGSTMVDHLNGTYTHLIEAESIKNYSNFTDAWIQFQLVSTDASLKIVDRTPVFGEHLALNQCL